MAEVMINGAAYSSFASAEFADIYLAADITHAEPWAALAGEDGEAEKARLLATATRILRRQNWRDGPPSYEDPPAAVAEATAEFAAALLAGYDLAVPPSSILQTKRQKAGSVEVEFFRNIDSAAYRPPPLPQAVWDLIAPLLGPAGGSSAGGAISYGTDGDSIAEGPGLYEGRYGLGSFDRDFL